MKLQVGSKIKFSDEHGRYTVQASNERFAICTKPFNFRHTVFYTIIDFQENIRGPENLVFGFGAETREQCEEMLARLTAPCDHPATDGDGNLIVECGCRTEISRRNSIRLEIETITECVGNAKAS